MNLEKYVAVSGMAGVYKVVANRSNGLMVEDVDTGKVKFASIRQHQFSPLASISVFIDGGEEDTTDLKTVFQSMLDKMSEHPPVDPGAAKKELMSYFEIILPNYDRDRVFPSHVSKLIKWFNFMNQRGLLAPEADASEEE